MSLTIFFGDSITVGQYVNPHQTWPHLISEKICSNDPSQLFQCVATNGDTTLDAVNKLDYHVLQHNPNRVLIQFGLNDANRWKTLNCRNRVPIADYEINLSNIIAALELSTKAQIILLTSHKIAKNHSCTQESSLIEDMSRYNSILRNFITEKKSTRLLLDLERISNNWPEQFLLEDGVHLSTLGHALYAREIEALF